MNRFSVKTLCYLLCILLYSESALPQNNASDHDSIPMASGITTVHKNQLSVLPFRNTGSVVLTGPNTHFLKGNNYYFDGLEASENYIFLDGMQLRDGKDFLFRSIRNFEYYRSNQPIDYGNIPGAMIRLESVSMKDRLQLEADFLTDLQKGYQDVLYEVLLSGPIRFRKPENRSWKNAPSFLVAGMYNKTNDPFPSWEEKYQTTDEYQGYINQNPYRLIESTERTYLNTEFSDASDFQKVDVHPEATRESTSLYVKLDVPIHEKMNIEIGSYFRNNQGKEYRFDNTLFNAANNPETKQRDLDNFFQWGHTVTEGPEFKLEYSLFFQYSDYAFQRYHERYEDNWFDYGYLGKYQTYKSPSFELGSIEIDGVLYENVWLLNSWDYDTTYLFESRDYNELASRYTEMIYEFFPDKGALNGPSGYWRNASDLVLNGGLRNGDQPEEVYNLWNSQGDVSMGNPSGSSYGESRRQVYRGKANIGMTWKTHSFLLGMEYNRRKESSYGIRPEALWTQMQIETNLHLTELDLMNPFLGNDTVYFPRRYNPAYQTAFDSYLRQKLGLPVEGRDFILMDSYDPVNHTIEYYDVLGNLYQRSTPEDLLELSMLDPLGLLYFNVVRYKGYTSTGEKLKGKHDPLDFYEDYSSSAYEPLYTSWYAEDRFELKNLSVRVGLRMDYFDARQPVLKDNYSLYETWQKADVSTLNGQAVSHPASVDDEAVVYVDNFANPTKVTGYRHEDTWYNDDGAELSDPSGLDVGNGVNPYLKYPELRIGSPEWNPDMTFKDYDPAIRFLPQINLNYQFWRMNVYGNYNASTNTNLDGIVFHPEEYLLINLDPIINNPALKPTRIDKLNFGSTVMLLENWFADVSYQMMWVSDYPEIKVFEGAFPGDYITLVNRDTAIPVQNVTAQIGVNPLEQAGWSGLTSFTYNSVPEENRYAINIPDFILNANLNYDFGLGPAFRWRDRNILKWLLQGLNVGLYYQYRTGTRLPEYPDKINNVTHSPDFSFVNLRVEKGFYFGKPGLYMSFYLWIENLLNQENVFYVDPNTGKVDDDGYLTDPESQAEINQQTDPDSYRYLYQLYLRDPTYYSKPRIIRAGLRILF